MAGLQLQLMMLVMEVWLDYLTAMQEVGERALDRLRDLGGGFAGRGHGGQDDGEW